MKKTINRLMLFSSIIVFWFQVIFVALVEAQDDIPLVHDASPPARLKDLQWIVGNIFIAIWTFSIPYFLFMIISIGARYMLSFGDEQKASAVKEKGKNLILSAVFLVGGYIVIQTVMSLFVFKDPDDCFKTELDDGVFFQFFFPNICSGVSST